MKDTLMYSVAALALAAMTAQANADTFQFSFDGGGVSGTATLTYGTATDAKYPQALELTGISGTFSDTNIGVFNASLTGLEATNHASPEPTNLLAPADFSRFPVVVGTQHGSLNFDNLFYPGGSPQSATDYPFHGGFLDIYGFLATIGDGRVVNIWSDGVGPGETIPDYGAAVATSAASLDYIGGGVAITPEPGTLGLIATGLFGAIMKRCSPSAEVK